jgi:hypothetical protein
MKTYLTGYVAKCGSDKTRARKAREPKPTDKGGKAYSEREE